MGLSLNQLATDADGVTHVIWRNNGINIELMCDDYDFWVPASDFVITRGAGVPTCLVCASKR